MEARSIQETTNSKNLLLLVMLRWLAVGGQIATILVVQFWLGVALPLVAMGVVVLFLGALNLISLYRCRSGAAITDTELFAELLLDVGALTVQLYLSGGAGNPFVSLFLLHIILAAMLLRPGASWALVAIASACFIWLIGYYREMDFSARLDGHAFGRMDIVDLHILGVFICFLLAAVLLVLFVTRINRNLRDQDRDISALRQQSTEEEYIVRIGLLASGAAHELGTPLAILSVIINDWEKMPALRDDPDIGPEIGEMQSALASCKDIVSRILLAAGEARGENAERTTVGGFLDDVVAEWRETRNPSQMDYSADIGSDTAIASDTVIRQILHNVFDNALEASPDWVGIEASRRGELLAVTVRDRGAGFAQDILANFGKPYQSTKGRSGRGLGLFLVVNVLRKLGGSVVATNNPGVGASVELRLPIGALSLESEKFLRMDKPSLLILEDDPAFARTLQRSFERRGYAAVICDRAEALATALETVSPAFAVVDLKLVGPSGLECVKILNSHNPAMKIVVLTGFASIATAVEAIKLGACHYLAKPSNADDIEAAFGREGGDSSVSLSPRATTIKTLEWERIHEMLAETEFNISETARRLGMHRRTLARKLTKRRVG